ncbi:feh-1 [Pristionchus pacificus]|nr:feh-1 [Pristionchus pacificus]
MRREEERGAERLRMEESIQISRDGQRVYDGRNEYELGRGRGDGGMNDYRSREGRIPPQDYGRRASHSSETATINFFHDDREEEWEEEVIEEKRSKSFNFTHTIDPIDRRDDRIGGIERRLRTLEEERIEEERRVEERREYERENRRNPHPLPVQRNTSTQSMAVDYSSRDFHQSLAAIDAASRERGERDGVRVTHQGDTTIVTEHRDPYSFYWQLDQTRRPDSPPRPRPPATDYIIDEEEVIETVLSPHSHDSGVISESQYSRPIPLPPRSLPTPVIERDDSPHRPLPNGWEKHQDPSGFSYYWHVDSGKIQRDPPRVISPPPPSPPPQPSTPVYAPPSRPTPQPPRVSPPPPQIIQLPPQQPVIEEHAFKQTTTKRRVENEESVEDGKVEEVNSKSIRFAVRSLGWIEIGEEEISAERSSKAVNGAIAQLSNGLGMEDGVAKWGDGRELIMEMDDNELRLLDPHSMNIIHTEKIHNIRVWGVGRENGRDFAYVARERGSRRLLCHVFRCDTPAKTIANTLRDICRRIVRGTSTAESITSDRRLVRSSELTAVDEPKKLIRCHFIGVTQVPRANGIDVLNDAVDRLVSQVGRHQWILSDVSIAPSTLIISEVNGSEIATCRVRYLSFLGIGRDIKHCAFIMQVSSDSFLCYVFHVEPSAAIMAKTIEAACKLRYQKLLDAHRPDHLSIGKEECDTSLLSPSSPIPNLSIPPSHSLPISFNPSSPSIPSSLPSSSSFDHSRLQVWYNTVRGAFSRLPSLSL